MQPLRKLKRLRRRSANVRFRELERLALDFGYQPKNVKGSEHTYSKPGQRIITFPNHPGAMKRYLVESVLDQLEATYIEEVGDDGNNEER